MKIADQLGIECPVFDVDNVAAYIEERGGFRIDDAPTAAPPFEQYFVEYGSRVAAETVGALVTAMDLNKLCTCGKCAIHVDDPRWSVKIQFFCKRWSTQIFEIEKWPLILLVRNDGYVATTLIGADSSDPDDHAALAPPEPFDSEEYIARRKSLLGLAGPVILATAFMHCKNVRHVEHVPGGAFGRARRRRGEKPLLRYCTLQIDPMKETLRREGQSETLGLKQALHICRGHFKDYRQSGLFGRIKGIFWWDQQLRGSASEGAVVKDYTVDSPTGGETVH